MPSIGKQIRKRREELGMTQEELANKLNYKSKTTIAKIENGTNDIAQSKVVEFAKALQTTPAYIMGWSDNPDGNDKYELYLNIKATNKREAIFNAVRSMLKINGDSERAEAITEDEAVKLYELSGFDNVQAIDTPTTIAAHFDGDEYTEEELDKIKEFAAFVKSNRKK